MLKTLFTVVALLVASPAIAQTAADTDKKIDERARWSAYHLRHRGEDD